MSDEPVKTEPSGISEWRWPSVIVLVAALGLVAFIYFIKTPERLVETAGKGALEVAKVLDEAAAKFRRGKITETFVASLPKLESERGGLLELAKVSLICVLHLTQTLVHQVMIAQEQVPLSLDHYPLLYNPVLTTNVMLVLLILSLQVLLSVERFKED